MWDLPHLAQKVIPRMVDESAEGRSRSWLWYSCDSGAGAAAGRGQEPETRDKIQSWAVGAGGGPSVDK